jgi:hypothetical protein
MGSGEAKIRGGVEFLEDGERALERGDSVRAFELLQGATRAGVPADRLHTLVTKFALAGRFTARQGEVLGWIEESLENATEPSVRATLLRAQRRCTCRRRNRG